MAAETTKRVYGFGKSIWNNGLGLILVMVSYGWFLVLGSRLVFPAVLPYIRQEFALTHTTAGFGITLLWLGYASTQFPSGILSDRYGEMRVLLLSGLFGLIALSLVAVAPNFWMFLFATVMYGIGSGLYATPRVTILTKIYSDMQGTVLGITYAGGNVGTTLLPACAGLLAVYISWRAGVGALVPLFGLLVILTAFVMSKGIISDETSSDPLEFELGQYVRIIKVVLSDPVFSIAAVMFFSSFAYQGLIGFYPTYLIEVKQIPPSTAALIYSLFFGFGVLFQLLSGVVSDRIGKASTILFIALINCTALVLLTFANSIIEIGVITLMLSVSLGTWPVTGAYAVAELPPDIEGSAFGLLRTAFLSLAATSPSIVGWFFDRELFDIAFFALATATAVSAIICFRLRHKHDL